MNELFLPAGLASQVLWSRDNNFGYATNNTNKRINNLTDNYINNNPPSKKATQDNNLQLNRVFTYASRKYLQSWEVFL